ncbi:hypothetical protein Q31b_24530 [Novipirellula aureliae]|uniref:Potassium channel protein n=1 Tax=Novipirellula aureliae TaxID=2527966 RepID=A0A5C6E4K0_9BACT|nr:potassium channel protein [Novipirellula aureliae]TWU43414.1 hypothetical protein Q31b_24530 [Novipirellula aureliae]
MSQKNAKLLWIAVHTAPVMFWLALIFLVCQAVLIVIWVDVPNLRENLSANVSEPVISSGAGMVTIESFAIRLMQLIWPIVIAESIFHWLTRPWNRQTRSFHFFSLLIAICPSLRMCAKSLQMGERIWLPSLGWRKADARMRRRLERRFSMPMIGIALLIMPVLIVEWFMKTQVADYRWLRFALHFSTGMIWFCFAAEFILMVSLAEKKFQYCRKHWIDLAIIILPLFSFLRSLRLLRATGITKLVRLSQLNQVARMYRLRGTAMRVARAMVLLDLIERMLHTSPEKSLIKLRRQHDELENQVKLIRRKIRRLEREIELSQLTASEEAENA